MMRDSFIPRAAMLSLALAMSACAARPAAPDPEVVRLDGVYRGTETTEATGADCAGSVRPVQFRVADGHVWNHRHSRHQSMEGNVDGAGRVTMQDESGQRQLSGTISDGRFTASETTAPGHSRSSPLQADEALSCLSRIEATRSAIPESGPVQ